jgi:cell division protein FtsQ
VARAGASVGADLARGWRDEQGRGQAGSRVPAILNRARPRRRTTPRTPPAAQSNRWGGSIFAIFADPTRPPRPVRAAARARPPGGVPPFRAGRVARTLVILLTLALGALGTWALTTLQVHHVRIVGTRDPTLLAEVRALPLAGCTIVRCDLARDAALVETLPVVAHADVQALYPDTLVVRITPRVPILIWRAAGQPYFIAADGTLIGPVDPGGAPAPALPLVDDPQAIALGGASHAQAGARLPRALVEMAAQLLRGLPGALGSGAGLRYDAGLGLVAEDEKGLMVVFGDPETLPKDVPGGGSAQLAELRAVLALLARQGETADWIDLRWGTHPAYRLAWT